MQCEEQPGKSDSETCAVGHMVPNLRSGELILVRYIKESLLRLDTCPASCIAQWFVYPAKTAQ